MAYELHHWPTIQGRGEFVRLALEAAGAPCVDVASGPDGSGQGVPAVLRGLHDPAQLHPPFAPPFLRDGTVLVGQTAAILHDLGPPLTLVGDRLSDADPSRFQLVEGLRYAFPQSAARALARAPCVVGLHERVAAQPRVASCLRSDRRLPFNEQGIFRRYPELDLPPDEPLTAAR
jgi:hypothetical protein